ncbi:chorismate mutase [Lentibacillus sp. Marseille-P4043]|uniref:chorismate mutase n=1 Tax=Lentibacillus sp. Marseille-P4043 TaxID=2040293 RepID=UPI000D0B55F2|nr:chorismate mutase [Lentibacillus sp. Marseille-P4043]
MIRGVRGATTVQANEENQIVTNTKSLVEDMVLKNNIEVDSISHVLISVSGELNATFPAKSLRQIPGWVYVPVMCMQEIDVPNSLGYCIRVMMVVNTTVRQEEIKHVFHHEAKQLRPDLMQRLGE